MPPGGNGGGPGGGPEPAAFGAGPPGFGGMDIPGGIPGGIDPGGGTGGKAPGGGMPVGEGKPVSSQFGVFIRAHHKPI